jgi:hypothetical protein
MLEEGTQETCRRDFLGVRGRKRKRGTNLKSIRTPSLFLILHLCSSNKMTPNCMSGIHTPKHAHTYTVKENVPWCKGFSREVDSC